MSSKCARWKALFSSLVTACQKIQTRPCICRNSCARPRSEPCNAGRACQCPNLRPRSIFRRGPHRAVGYVPGVARTGLGSMADAIPNVRADSIRQRDASVERCEHVLVGIVRHEAPIDAAHEFAPTDHLTDKSLDRVERRAGGVFMRGRASARIIASDHAAVGGGIADAACSSARAGVAGLLSRALE